MAHLFKLDVLPPREAPAARPEVLRIVQLLNALAAEHARAMRAAGKAQLPRRNLAELRAWYCFDSPDSVRATVDGDE